MWHKATAGVQPTNDRIQPDQECNNTIKPYQLLCQESGHLYEEIRSHPPKLCCSWLNLPFLVLTSHAAFLLWLLILLRMSWKNIEKWNLQPDSNGWFCARMKKAMCGLPKSWVITNKHVTAHLQLFGHETRNFFFTLVTDDFRICHIDIDNANHLIEAI